MANQSQSIKYKSVSISLNNYEELMAIAANLSDNHGMTVSINSAIGALIKGWKENN